MKEIILYGAGKMGQAYLQFLKRYHLDSYVKCFCDQNAGRIENVDGKSVCCYEDVASSSNSFVIALRKEYADAVIQKLEANQEQFYPKLDNLIVDELHLMTRAEYEREMCAVSHIDSMDTYFDIAETEGSIARFWGEGDFLTLFRKLNLENVVELACGRGRHVPQYIKEARHVTLVDILEKNIYFCKSRFAGEEKISYVVNNGYDLSALADASYSALFAYDSMVHFELLDIANYLKETYRILKPGGRALFHHSNNDADYKASFDNAVESRSFMNKDIFAYLAYRAGFEIVEQRVVDWVHPKLDCLTLVEKR